MGKADVSIGSGACQTPGLHPWSADEGPIASPPLLIEFRSSRWTWPKERSITQRRPYLPHVLTSLTTERERTNEPVTSLEWSLV